MTASRSKTPPERLPEELRVALQDFLESLDRDGTLSGSTRVAYGRDLRVYLGHAADRGARDPAGLTLEVVRGHVDDLRAAGRSPATVARSISSLRRFHEHLHSVGRCSGDPTQGLAPPRVDRGDPDPLTLDEAERLVGAVRGDEPLSLRDRAVLELLYAAGLRVSELTGLTGADLLLERSIVRVRGRGARERIVPIGRAAVSAADRYARFGRPLLAASAGDDAFLLSSQGRRLSRMSVWKIVQAAAASAGIDRAVNAQTLRHTFAAHLLEGGFGLSDVQSLLGHADISTTLIYARADDERLRQLHRAYHPRG